MNATPPLPDGFSARAPTPDDAEAVAALGIAQDVDDLGQADYGIEDVRSEWAAPGFDLGSDAWLVLAPGGEPAAYGALDAGDARVFTDPRYKGRGIGAFLAARIEALALEQHASAIRQMTFGGNDAARDLLARHGYALEQHYWRMRVDEPAAASAPGWPADLDVGTFDPGRDLAEVHALIQRAFAEVPGFLPQELDPWRAQWGSGERLEPELTPVARYEGALIGVATCGRWTDGRAYVTQLAVDPGARGQGLGRALLLETFGRAGEAGIPSVGLDVNAANAGAVALYESAGMQVEWQSDRWGRRLPT